MEQSVNDIRIIQGDAVELFSTLPDASVDLIVADPPYNLGKDYGNNLDQRSFNEYLAFSRKWSGEAKRVLKPQGTLYSFMGVRFISYLFAILEQELGLLLNSWITWHYTQGMGRTKGFSPRHEDILMFTKTAEYRFNLDNVRVPQKYYRARNNMRGANPGDVWLFSHVHYSHSNRFSHPTQKPEALIARMVLASSEVGDLVLAPFSGSGTTLRVCQQLRRNAVGFEINPDYVQMTRDRLAKPFSGFDSIDPRMQRIPNDLRDDEMRREYLSNHAQWFLGNQPDALKKFQEVVDATYGDRSDRLNPIQSASESRDEAD